MLEQPLSNEHVSFDNHKEERIVNGFRLPVSREYRYQIALTDVFLVHDVTRIRTKSNILHIDPYKT